MRSRIRQEAQGIRLRAHGKALVNYRVRPLQNIVKIVIRSYRRKPISSVSDTYWIPDRASLVRNDGKENFSKVSE